ncbi:AAA family ATPase [Hyalangium minutum]|uniref:TonB-dependent receptor n=1 Tax=Hyalangium minutum TaxID=394096 RepID=A0A085WTN0_9BACT|nr:AAA family ATPase [Hyalangium minutum]KFE71043.1 TonB-dependent receptor [Hyalangium minutum]
MSHQNDLRLSAFFSDTEVFHPIQHRHDMWRQDPFDVETIHKEARSAFERLLLRATTPPRPESGRILLLLGDSGCGKTHLMRAFRSRAHERSLGFVGYMQMTTAQSSYGRYMLNNLVDSLDQPYLAPSEPRSGLERLSGMLLERCSKVAALLADSEQDADEVPALVDIAADELKGQPLFERCDLDLMRALLFLQRNDTRIKSRVLKYLRCEDLSEGDRKVLGGLVPRIHDHHPLETVEHLGRLVAALDHSLVLCVDQLEGFNDFESQQVPHFRRAMTALCDLADRVPSSIIVISCLHNFWQGLSNQLTQSLRDRIENAPPFIKLEAQRTADEARLITERRLEHLYALKDAPFDYAEPTYPFPHEGFEALSGHRAREVLDTCRRWREHAISTGVLPHQFPLSSEKAEPLPEVPPQETLALDQEWNDFRTGHSTPPPEEDSELSSLLAWALQASMDELETGHRVQARSEGEALFVELTPGDQRLRLAFCNKGAQRGALARQIEQVRKDAKGRIPVAVRSSSFPNSPKSEAALELGKLLSKGGRNAVLEDSDCRLILALKAFRQQHESYPGFAAWLRSTQPLSQLKPLRDILDLDHLSRPAAVPGAAPAPAVAPQTESSAPAPVTAPPVAAAPPRAAPERQGTEQPPPQRQPSAPSRARGPVPLRLGAEESLLKEEISLLPDELTKHAAFLGGSGSGKTTLALNVIEQLLLQGIPAILVDRKGDLAGYATEEFWTRSASSPERAERQARLRECLDVALFTPGHPQGRPLSIAIVPEGLAQLPEFDRQLATRHAADALAGMLDYRQSPRDKSCRTLLSQAIDQYVQLSQQTVALEPLIQFIGDKDPRLVSAAGRLDTKLFDKLADDLDRLRIDTEKTQLLGGSGADKLDMDLLLGRGAHARPGKTRLSVLSTRFLGDTHSVLFWISQFLIEVTRWLNRSPSSSLQAVILFDEADMYLPATRQPATKQPMENLLKRARSGGLGLMLATQSPGDFDYKCRDTIRSWFVGRVKEKNSLDKMRPMLSEARVDFTAKIPQQTTGEFHLIREGKVNRFRADPSALSTEQLAEEELLRLAARTQSRP